MKSYKIRLGSPEGIKDFVSATSKTACDVHVVSEDTVVDGKSVLALFSLPMGQPVTIRVDGSDEECKKLLDQLESLSMMIDL